MSTYKRKTKHPVTGKWEIATWHDDYFGHYLYGVEFSDGRIFDPREYQLETMIEGQDDPDLNLIPCVWCGKTYDQHADEHPNGAVPRVPCLMLKANFVSSKRKQKVNRTDVQNIVDSVNMTLKDYGIRFEFNEREDLQCTHDGVPAMINKERKRALETAKSYIINKKVGSPGFTVITEAMYIAILEGRLEDENT